MDIQGWGCRLFAPQCTVSVSLMAFPLAHSTHTRLPFWTYFTSYFCLRWNLVFQVGIHTSFYSTVDPRVSGHHVTRGFLGVQNTIQFLWRANWALYLMNYQIEVLYNGLDCNTISMLKGIWGKHRLYMWYDFISLDQVPYPYHLLIVRVFVCSLSSTSSTSPTRSCTCVLPRR